MNDFAGKVAFVTGAGAGFGTAFARALAERGAAVAVVDIDAEAARATAGAMEADGLRAAAIPCDVADDASVAAAVDQTARIFGGIDILINNAGLHSTAYNQSFRALGMAQVRRLFDVNVMGLVQCSLAVQPFMAARGGGQIVNIASIASSSSSNAYGVSKLTVRGLTIALATEMAGDNIRVNAISPGLMLTDTIRAELPADVVSHFRDDLQLVKRSGEERDIVSAMLFLCSDQAGFITGETLKVAGGYPLYI